MIEFICDIGENKCDNLLLVFFSGSIKLFYVYDLVVSILFILVWYLVMVVFNVGMICVGLILENGGSFFKLMSGLFFVIVIFVFKFYVKMILKLGWIDEI